MTCHRYRIYYEYTGPSKAAPFRSLKSADEVAWALERVPQELPPFLEDRDPRISSEPETDSSIFLTVETFEPDADFLKALERCISGLDLYGTKLTP
jgi:hypothetical protein